MTSIPISSSNRFERGVTLVELLVAMVLGGFVMAGMSVLFNLNNKESTRLHNRNDIRNQMTLSLNRIGKHITMAGFGTRELNPIRYGSGLHSDTLVLFQNPKRLRTTIVDTAWVSMLQLNVADTAGFSLGGYLGITDGTNQEIHKIQYISSSYGLHSLYLIAPLMHQFNKGEPDIYPLEKYQFHADAHTQKLVITRNDANKTYIEDILEFRAKLRDTTGNVASSITSLATISFEITGKYRSHARDAQMKLSSTVIPRNKI